MSITWLLALAACGLAYANADRGGSSLRGALEALQRRQRGRTPGPIITQPDYDSLYEFIPPQGYPEPDYAVDVEDLEEEPSPKYVIKLLDDDQQPPETYEYKIIKKKNTVMAPPMKKESPFRERSHHVENDRLRDLFMDKNDEEKKENEAADDSEYALLLGQLWSKYKYNKAHPNTMESAPQGVVKLYKDKIVKKRYPDIWGPIAFKRKRSSGSETDHPNMNGYENTKQAGTVGPIYNGYEFADDDDDKDDLREEYAIAFQPLDDDNLPDLGDENLYAYDPVEKRFPVTKRSSGPYDFQMQKKRFVPNQNKRDTAKSFRSSAGTDPKVLKDLSKIFGDSEMEMIKTPVKRSSDHIEREESSHEGKPPTLTILNHNNSQARNDSSKHEDDSHEHHGHNIHHPGILGEEVSHDIKHNHEHSHNGDHSTEHTTAHASKDVEKPITIKKKSIDWSDYFGIDKRTKRPLGFVKDLTQDKLRKQYLDTFNKEVIYPLNTFAQHSNVKRNYVQPKSTEETEFKIDRALAVAVQNDDKRDTAKDNDSKLDSIDKKLRSMEGLIVDEALHYSNIGEELDSKEEQEMKEKLLSRLAAAYSLEKMRKALKEFKQSLQTQKAEMASAMPTDEAKSKRVAVKKELITDNDIPAYNNNKNDDKNIDFEEEQGAGHYLNGKTEEPFSEGYMGGSGRHRIPVMSTTGTSGSCPVLAKIVQRCRGVDLLAGDRGQLFLPLCSLHQICYLCGEAPPTTCDLLFLSEADTTCEGDMGCQRAARSALMALRELHDNLADELDGEYMGDHIVDKNGRGIENPAATQDDGSPMRPDLVISIQPQLHSARAELPVTTVNWRSNPRGQFIPVHGLDFLIGVTSLLIQQTVELTDLISKIESENRYIVRVPNGEALYIASEASSPTQRCLCGSGRAFTMHLHDNTRQEAMVLKRRLAGASCLFPCRLQEMKVVTPPGDYVGRVQQKCTWVVPVYNVRDAIDQIIFVIEGPAVLKRSALMLSEFKIMTPDSLREVGRISHGWDRDLVSFATTLQIPDIAVQPKHKSLLLAAVFLLEYTYFVRSKSSCMRCCNCF
ncbi:hypothetical protein K1T71_001686 [Dendrolimus kikuchii]|uniref:Uncharacterized protein n=1 Tax=Dendrolimus kikuchii TaxID=765133 RepID=A0ACC1DFW6_9NEOP|nr:hypothetical protein K1T71_001686 [Dendrolimus kikuchii]